MTFLGWKSLLVQYLKQLLYHTTEALPFSPIFVCGEWQVWSVWWRWWRVSPDCWLITPSLTDPISQSEATFEAVRPIRCRAADWLLRHSLISVWLSRHGTVVTHWTLLPDICWTLSKLKKTISSSIPVIYHLSQKVETFARLSVLNSTHATQDQAIRFNK